MKRSLPLFLLTIGLLLVSLVAELFAAGGLLVGELGRAVSVLCILFALPPLVLLALDPAKEADDDPAAELRDRSKALQAVIWRDLVEGLEQPCLVWARDGQLFAMNHAASALFGKAQPVNVPGTWPFDSALQCSTIEDALSAKDLLSGGAHGCARSLELVDQGQRTPLTMHAIPVDGGPDDPCLFTLFRAPERSGDENALQSARALAARQASRINELEVMADYRRGIIGVLPFGVCILDRQRQLIESNNAFHGLLASTAEDVLARARDAEPEDPAEPTFDSLLDDALACSVPQVSKLNLTVGDRTRSIEFNAVRIYRDREPLLLVTANDLSSYDTAAAALVEAKLAAESASEAKTRFLAKMSHEIRTPMNGALGMISIVMRTDLDERQKGYLVKAQRSAQSLLAIIDDILDLSKIESGTLHFEQRNFSLAEALATQVELLALRADEKHIELLLDIDAAVPDQLVGDPFRLGQVISNLIGNAIKFTAAGGHVRLNVRIADTDGEMVTLAFSVVDNGIGIDPDDLDRLFDAFEQVGSAPMTRTGVGLGLAICKNLVAQMGGNISVSSIPGKGSTFSFSANFAIGTENGTLPARSLPPGLRVLVIDDRPIAAEILVAELGILGVQADMCDAGEKGLAKLGEAAAAGSPYDLALVDWRMPGMDGVSTVRAIRELDASVPQPLVVMFSAADVSEVREALAGLEVDAVLSKPVVPRTLESVLADVVRSRPKRAEQGDGELTASQRDSLVGRYVLVVDDNAINRELIVEMLRDYGVETAEAVNGREAVDKVDTSSRPFDCVLMDLQMPVLDGHSATRELRTRYAPDVLPVIAVTASVMGDEREISTAVGMNDHIVKPFDAVHLSAVVARCVRGLKRGDRIVENPKPAKPKPAREDDTLQFTDEAKAALSDAGVDVEAALSALGGHGALYARMLIRFRDEHRDYPSTFRRVLADEGPIAATRAAHSLKGVVAMLKMFHLKEAALKLEEACQGRSNPDDALDRVGSMLDEVNAAIDLIDGATAPKADVAQGEA